MGDFLIDQKEKPLQRGAEISKGTPIVSKIVGFTDVPVVLISKEDRIY